MRKREAEALLDELLDVWSAEVADLLDLDNLEDLERVSENMLAAFLLPAILTWMVLKRARWREAMSW